MKSYTILLNGDLCVTKRLINQMKDSAVIAADGAMRYARPLGIVPELWVGDFDSADPDLMNQYVDVERRRFPVAKDKTDGELAVDFALQKGARNLVLCGALGGKRTDHALFHLTYAVALKEQGIDVLLTNGGEEGYAIIPGHYTFDLPEKTVFSIIGLTDLGALSIEGAKWPLDNKDVPFGSSLTVSNEVSGQLRLSLCQGKAILLATLPAND